MARRRRRRARNQKKGGKSILKIFGIVVLLSLPVLYFLFTEFVFDPFEGSVGPFQELVPREVDVYVRRERLDSDFDIFPMPRELSRLKATPGFRELERSDWYSRQDWITELSGVSSTLDAALADAPFDPLADLLGSEVVVLSRLPDGVGDPAFAYLARMSGAGRAAYGLLDQAAVRERILPGAEVREVDDPDYPTVKYQRVDLPDGSTWFVARELDMLVAGNNETLIRDVLRTTKVKLEQSLGLTRLYAQDLPVTTSAPEDHFSTELFLDVPAYLASGETDEDLAERSANAATNMLRKVIDVTLLQDMIARVEVENGSLSIDAHAMVNSQRASSVRNGLVGQESFRVGDHLEETLGHVPLSVVGAVTAKVDVSELLETLYASFSDDIKTLVNGVLREMSRLNPGWRGASNSEEMISLLEVVLRDEFTLVARPIDHELPVDIQPMPALALIAPIGNLEAWQGLERAFQQGMRAFGLGGRDADGEELRNWTVPEGIGDRVWFETSGLPFTELAYILIEEKLLVIGTDNDLVKEIIEVFAGAKPSLASKPAVRDMIARVADDRANLAVWVEGRGLTEILELYSRWIADDRTRIDYGVLRVQRRREIIDRDYAQYRGREDLPGTVEAEIDEKLDQMLRAEEDERRATTVPAEAAKWLDGFAWLRVLKDGLVAIDQGTRDADARLIVNTASAR